MDVKDKRAANYLLLAFCGISVVFLSLPTTGKVRGLKALLAYMMDPLPFYGGEAVGRLTEAPADITRLILADVENHGLRESLKETELLRAEVEALRRENERLSYDLKVSSQVPRLRHWARVIERDPVNWNSSLMIAAGLQDGIEVNSPVVGIQGAKLGVVGRVTEVGQRTSKVLLLSDPLSAAAAYLPSKGWEGLAQGKGIPRLHLNYLPVDALFAVGDTVYTSPTSATFPPDILIGSVSRILPRVQDLGFQSVEVAPAISPSTLKEVIILSPGLKRQT